VTVQHVNVSGGQAIVGNVTQGGGLPTKTKDQPHAQVTHAPGATMQCALETVGEALQVTGSEGK
jgi:hypothetical protein